MFVSLGVFLEGRGCLMDQYNLSNLSICHVISHIFMVRVPENRMVSIPGRRGGGFRVSESLVPGTVEGDKI